MQKFSFIFLSLFISIVFAACSAGNFSSKSSDSAANTASATPQPKDKLDAGGGGGNKSPFAQQVSLEQASNSQTPAPDAVTRKIIRNAEMTLEADSPDEAQAKITAIAESKGGFVIESQKQINDTKATKTDVVTMTVRVPSAKFDESLEEIRKASNRVIVETIKGQDVTEEFIDVEARLKTQKALEAQFLEIMKQAKTVDEALDVQSKIADVRGEIEKVEGRKHFLENQSAFSTLKIRLQSPAAFSASSSGFFYQIKQAFASGFDAALSFILILITIIIALLPFLILVVLPIYLIIRYFLRKNRKLKLAGEIAREEIRTE
ncbi:MAG: DUF4349 domain-containing protein [Pyrinomonadaceae bacterium]